MHDLDNFDNDNFDNDNFGDLDNLDDVTATSADHDGSWASWSDPHAIEWSSLGYDFATGGILDDPLDAAGDTAWLDHASLDEASWRAWDPTREVDEMVEGPWPTVAGPFDDGFA